jgi:hypothetical protein
MEPQPIFLLIIAHGVYGQQMWPETTVTDEDDK